MVPIIYEDNHLLVVSKPHNMPTQADRSGDPDLLTTLKNYIKVEYRKPGNVYLGLVHRLDRPVGGVIVFAKTSKAASRLANSIRLQQFQRHYLAVVHGKPKQASARLTHYLLKDKEANIVSAVSQQTPGAQQAELTYHVIASADHDAYSLVNIQLHTGRSHQIRVQMNEIGHPLYGDQKYGSTINKPGQQIALWAASLSFPHPTKKEPLTFTAPPQLQHQFPWNLWPESSLA